MAELHLIVRKLGGFRWVAGDDKSGHNNYLAILTACPATAVSTGSLDMQETVESAYVGNSLNGCVSQNAQKARQLGIHCRMAKSNLVLLRTL